MNDYCIHFDKVKVALLELRVWVGEKEVHLTPTEMRVLFKLLEEPYRTIQAEELIKHAGLTSREYLWIVIYRLRKVFNRRYVITHNGVGFSFARIPWEEWERQRNAKQQQVQDV